MQIPLLARGVDAQRADGVCGRIILLIMINYHTPHPLRGTPLVLEGNLVSTSSLLKGEKK